MHSILCVTTALLFDGAVVGGRESLVLTIQIRISRQRKGYIYTAFCD